MEDPDRDGNGRFKPGNRANPTGKNQFAYRREFEAEIDRYLAEPPEGETLSRGALLARVAVDRALRGEEMPTTVLNRVWPAVTKHSLDAEQMPSSVTFTWDDAKPTEDEK